MVQKTSIFAKITCEGKHDVLTLKRIHMLSNNSPLSVPLPWLLITFTR